MQLKSLGCLVSSLMLLGSPFATADLQHPGPTKVTDIVVGYFGHVLVRFEPTGSCNGMWESFLRTDNPRFKEIYSALLTAKTSGTSVILSVETTGSVYGSFCTITELAVGGWRPVAW
jgi:hypothetical protein